MRVRACVPGLRSIDLISLTSATAWVSWTTTGRSRLPPWRTTCPLGKSWVRPDCGLPPVQWSLRLTARLKPRPFFSQILSSFPAWLHSNHNVQGVQELHAATPQRRETSTQRPSRWQQRQSRHGRERERMWTRLWEGDFQERNSGIYCRQLARDGWRSRGLHPVPDGDGPGLFYSQTAQALNQLNQVSEFQDFFFILSCLFPLLSKTVKCLGKRQNFPPLQELVTLFYRAVTLILSQRLLHKITTSRLSQET